MFLLSQTRPDYGFLTKTSGIHNLDELKTAVAERLAKVDLTQKKRDFEHLLFDKNNSERILLIGDFIRDMR